MVSHVTRRAQPFLLRLRQCTPAALSMQYWHRLRMRFLLGVFRRRRAQKFLKLDLRARSGVSCQRYRGRATEVRARDFTAWGALTTRPECEARSE